MAMASFPSDDPIWKILAAIDDEPTGDFSNLVRAAQLDPKSDFRNAFLVNLPLRGADISGFDFSGSDLRGTGLRYAAKSQGVIISKDTILDAADQDWWERERVKRENIALRLAPVGQQSSAATGLREPLSGFVPRGTIRGGAIALSVPFASPFTSRAEAASAVQTADLLLIIALFLIMIGGYHVHAMLTMGDWDFWIDWKDRRMWPTVLPIVLITFPAAAQYYFWNHFRLPFGATFLCLALLTGEWINRYVNFWGWTFFPLNLVWPTSLIPQAMFLDIVLLLSRSWIVTMVVGSLGFSLLLYPNNWVILAPFHQPTEQYGTLMTLADYLGFSYVRTSMPEYIRIIERGTMRTFGKDVVGVAAFFAGFVGMMVYFWWWFVGKMFSTTKYMAAI
jgi:methane/ammonia monooxygenase subunit A